MWRRSECRRNVKQLGHVGDRRRRGAVREGDRPGPVPRTTIIVADRPTAGATQRVRRRDGRRCDIADAREAEMLAMNDEVADQYSAHQATPEHEAGSAQE